LVVNGIVWAKSPSGATFFFEPTQHANPIGLADAKQIPKHQKSFLRNENT
jgi:hypothetical protein